MTRRLFSSFRSRLWLGLTLGLSLLVLGTCAVLFRSRSFLGDSSLDERTFIAPSTIPGAGNGLFAARDLKEGEVIAEMGGQLVFEEQFAREQRGYLFVVPACGKADVWPYNALDGRVLGGHASKINFAPHLINGLETHLQNAIGEGLCRRPYVRFKAKQDIPRGAEILASYGWEYGYDFMEFAAVREHFCKAASIDCTQGFIWEP